MSRRADPKHIYLARRAAILPIPTTSGVSPDRGEPLVREWETDAGLDGRSGCRYVCDNEELGETACASEGPSAM